MRVICAPDKLRGALDAAAAAAALATGVRRAGGEPVPLPIGDGGEGTLQALVDGGRARCIEVATIDEIGRAHV